MLCPNLMTMHAKEGIAPQLKELEQLKLPASTKSPAAEKFTAKKHKKQFQCCDYYDKIKMTR